MKWFLLLLALVAVVLVIWVYGIIPSSIHIQVARRIPSNQKALYRSLGDQSDWNNWWPGEKNTDIRSRTFVLNGHSYHLDDQKASSLEISVSNGKMKLPSTFLFLSTNPDSSIIYWDTKLYTGTNPIGRVRANSFAEQVEDEMKQILDSIAVYYATIEHLYHFDIRKSSVIDSTLVSTFTTANGYPGNKLIYGLIDELRAYIKSHSARETGNPMLNVSTTDSIHFLTRVAIPTDKVLPTSGNISYKRMLGNANILLVDVKGGDATVSEAFKQVEYYIRDFSRNSPAIHFFSLTTDRRAEPDTSKWVTRIYYPLM